MPIIPWKPFWEMEKWFEEEWLDDWFGKPKKEMGKWLKERSFIRTPRMDIYEKDNNIVAEVELPGVKPENIDVEVKNNILRIEANAREEKEIKEKGYYQKETGTRYFKRTVSLPAEVIGEKAEAEYANGILKVIVPKAKPKEEKEKKIKIKIK